MPGPAVVVERVSLALGGVEILREVSLRIEPGEVVCVVGPNGGGKTSLIRCILGQMPHTGEIRFEGGEPVRLGYAPQVLEMDRTLPLSVTDVMTVMVQRAPAFLGVRKKHLPAIEAALDRVGFVGKRGRRFGGLSGGERQRVLFAQALLPEPNLLILDEPASNMDEAGARRIEETVGELKAKGATVLWVSHDLDQVARVADRAILVSGGGAVPVSAAGAAGAVAGASGARASA